MKSTSSFSTLLSLTKRNIKCFVRDKAGLFFSFLSPLIILFLYIFFLGDLQERNIAATLTEAGVSFSLKNVSLLVDSWLMSGIITISSITVTLGVSNIIVIDKENKIDNDLKISPTSPHIIMLSYFLAVFAVSLVINITVLFVTQVYMSIASSSLLPFISFAKVLDILILSLITSTMLVVFIVSFIKSSNVYATFSSIIGTALGFLIGAYMPISMFPQAIQIFSNTLPFSHAGALIRKIMIQPYVVQLTENAPAIVSDTIADSFSLNLYFGNYQVPIIMMYGIIAASIVVFSILNLIHFKRMNKTN